ncbi:MAG: helix-turn-helix transcriptional regulator [Candidatus Sulfotelmatobacter sp.]
MAKVLHTYRRVIREPKEVTNVIDLDQVKVTPRDQQVLNLLVQGCSNKEIGSQLNISPRTVKQHLRTLFLRAGIREGRKRVKLAIAMFNKEEAQS